MSSTWEPINWRWPRSLQRTALPVSAHDARIHVAYVYGGPVLENVRTVFLSSHADHRT